MCFIRSIIEYFNKPVSNEVRTYYGGKLIDSYIEASVIVGGALDEDRIFYTPEQYETWLARVKTENFGGEIAEIYVITHEHSPALTDCNCVQFLTDHKPEWTSEAV